MSYHVFTSVTRVVDAKNSLTPRVRSSPVSASLSPEFTFPYRVKVREPTNERECCVEVVHAIVLGLPRVHPNTTNQGDAHFYPLRAPVKAVDR